VVFRFLSKSTVKLWKKRRERILGLKNKQLPVRSSDWRKVNLSETLRKRAQREDQKKAASTRKRGVGKRRRTRVKRMLVVLKIERKRLTAKR